MRRPGALKSEVRAGRDDAATEEDLPETVDGDPRGQRVLIADHPVREIESVETTTFLTTDGAQHGGHTTGDRTVEIGLVVLTAHHDIGLAGHRPLLHDHGLRHRGPCFGQLILGRDQSFREFQISR